MPVVGDYEFLVTVKDMASGQMRDITIKTSKDAQQLEQSLLGLQKATGGQSKEVGNLTKFYREQRAEQRMQSFYYREGRQLIGAVALGLSGMNTMMGQSSNDMKRLNQSLIEGFMAFQGLEFALSALGAGSWGMVIAGIAGVAAVIAGLTKENTAEKLRELGEVTKQFVKDMAGGTTKEYELAIATLNEELKINKQRLRTAEENKKAYQALFAVQGDVTKATDDYTKELDKEIARYGKIIPLQEEYIKTLEAKLPGAAEKYKKSVEDVAKANEEMIDGATKWAKYIAEILDVETFKQIKINAQLEIKNRLLESEIKIRGKLLTPVEAPPPVVRSKKDLDVGREMRENVEREFSQMGLTVENVSYMITDSMRGAADAITDAFFGASNSIEQFFLSMIKRVAAAMIEEWILKGLLGLFFPGVGGAVGTAVSASGGFGQSVAQRQRNSGSIEELIYTGK